jgi:hypothetical protein
MAQGLSVPVSMSSVGLVCRYPSDAQQRFLAGVTHSKVVSKRVPKGHDGRKGIVAASQTKAKEGGGHFTLTEGRRATSCSGQRPEALNCQPWIIASWPFSFRPSWAEAAVMAQDEPLLKCVHAWQARETEPQQDAEALALQLTKSTVLSAQISTLDRSADLPSAYFPSRST